MNRLNARKHLLGNHDYGLDGEASAAVVEQILKGGAKQVDNQDVVKALLPEVIDVGNTSCGGCQIGLVSRW